MREGGSWYIGGGFGFQSEPWGQQVGRPMMSGAATDMGIDMVKGFFWELQFSVEEVRSQIIHGEPGWRRTHQGNCGGEKMWNRHLREREGDQRRVTWCWGSTESLLEACDPEFEVRPVSVVLYFPLNLFNGMV